MSSEFWLGHEKINLVTSSETQLSLLTGYNYGYKSWPFVVLYEWFMLGREYGSYQLYYSKTSGSDNKLPVRKPFVTADRPGGANCGNTTGSYWHKLDSSCIGSNLFGKPNEGGRQGAQWYGENKRKVANWKWKIKTFQSKFRCVYHVRESTTELYEYWNDNCR